MNAAAILVSVTLCGCESVSRISLTQPQISGRQHHLELTSAQTYWSIDGRVERILAEIPLPGAGTGRPIYLLYLRVTPPLMKASKHPPEPYDVKGFFVQTRGEYAGRVDVKSGRVTAVRLSSDRHDVDVEIELEDSSRLRGRLAARHDDSRLRFFETDRRPGDVQSILHQDQ